VTREDPGDGAAGLVVIRVWIESGENGHGEDGLRARITTVVFSAAVTEQTFTVTGVERALSVVRGFLGELGERRDGGVTER
jgi:hypothetical protein